MGSFECVEVYSIAENLRKLIDEPYTNAQKLGRVFDRSEPLSDLLKENAEAHAQGRWHIRESSQAITLLGFERLKGMLERFIRERPIPAQGQPEPMRLRPRYVVVG